LDVGPEGFGGGGEAASRRAGQAVDAAGAASRRAGSACAWITAVYGDFASSRFSSASGSSGFTRVAADVAQGERRRKEKSTSRLARAATPSLGRRRFRTEPDQVSRKTSRVSCRRWVDAAGHREKGVSSVTAEPLKNEWELVRVEAKGRTRAGDVREFQAVVQTSRPKSRRRQNRNLSGRLAERQDGWEGRKKGERDLENAERIANEAGRFP